MRMRSAGPAVLAALVAIVAGTPLLAAAVAPSFDCAKSDGEVEELICADSQLAQLDNELSRLYRLASSGSNVDAARLAELRAFQRGWIKGRNDCWKATDKRSCVVDSYGLRIAELRAGYANARSADGKGISRGPRALACQGADFGIGVTFIDSTPAIASLSWLKSSVTLTHRPPDTGGAYVGSSHEGDFRLQIRGEEALFTLPGRGELKCRNEEIG